MAAITDSDPRPGNIEPQQPTPPLSRETRLKWWWGIYFLGVLCHPSALALFFLFPFGLADDYERVIPWAAKAFWDGYIPIIGLYLFGLNVLAYGTYLLHFILTWRAENRRVFLFLMLSLVLIVAANVAGCHQMAIDDHNHPIQ